MKVRAQQRIWKNPLIAHQICLQFRTAFRHERQVMPTDMMEESAKKYARLETEQRGESSLEES